MDQNDNLSEKIRLSKLMSQRGLCSRREADLLIESGQVKVNGEVLSQLGVKVDIASEIIILKDGQRALDKKATIIIHKPIGYVSSQPEDGYLAAVELVTSERQIFLPGDRKFQRDSLYGLAPAGRLDIDSKGLLVLTQDGTVAKQIIGEQSEIQKEYLVWVQGEITETKLKKLSHGLELDGKQLKHAEVRKMAPQRLKFILIEGKKRQIRRMCEMVDLKVTSLKRIRVGNVKLGDLPEGHWRYLGKDESF